MRPIVERRGATAVAVAPGSVPWGAWHLLSVLAGQEPAPHLAGLALGCTCATTASQCASGIGALRSMVEQYNWCRSGKERCDT